MQDTTAPEPGRVTHQSLERGLTILETLAVSGGPTSLAEVVRRTGLHRSTAHHLLQALVGLGYLRQDAASRGYELTARLLRLSGRSWSAAQLGEIAQPYLADITRQSGEGASLAAWRDGAVTIVAKRDADGPVRIVQDVGAERPIHATAVGKAIVAWLPEAERANAIAGIRFERHTPKTIATRPTLEAELKRIRAAGHATDDEEHIEGIRCLATPVFGHASEVVGALCVLGPKSRMSQQRLRALRPPMAAVARAFSERLGWRAEPG